MFLHPAIHWAIQGHDLTGAWRGSGCVARVVREQSQGRLVHLGSLAAGYGKIWCFYHGKWWNMMENTGVSTCFNLEIFPIFPWTHQIKVLLSTIHHHFQGWNGTHHEPPLFTSFAPWVSPQIALFKALVHAIDLDPLVLRAAETVGLMPPALHGTERWAPWALGLRPPQMLGAQELPSGYD